MGEWAEVADVKDRWVGEGFPDEADTVATLLDDAERTVVWEYPNIADRLVDDDTAEEDLPDDPLPVERLRMVLCRMVIRHLRNPEGARQIGESEGPFSRNRTLAGDRPGELALTDEERRMLGYLAGSPEQKAFTVPQATPTGHVYLGGGGDSGSIG